MTSYVALLRGINVGGNNRLAMADLRSLLGGLGYTDVRTVLQSGNAVFSTMAGSPTQLAEHIAAAIELELGLTIGVLVRTGADLLAVVDGNPFVGTATEPSKLFASFLSAPVAPARIADVDPAQFLPAEFRLTEQALYLWCPDGISNTKLPLALSDKKLGVTATARNWNTVTKLLTLLS